MNAITRYFLLFVLALDTGGLIAKKKVEEEELKPELRELMAIVEAEDALVLRMRDNVAPDKLRVELNHRIDSIENQYRAYIEHYPDSVFAQILFGKFLRKTNQDDQAYKVFKAIQDDTPEIAVVNQHLALHASEKGDYADAWKYFKNAIELEPTTALYHYQFGVFVYTYKTRLITKQFTTVSKAEDLIINAFRTAAELDPDNRDFKLRWAETYFDMLNPNWNEVLPIWEELMATSRNQFEKDVIRMQTARVLAELKRFYEARQLVEGVDDPTLLESKQKLLDMLP
ncbi:MAG: hypothetical protein MI748_00775 [Opitutales bacterium]|nr:hypothetical protein [Opitutales bacterium]